MLNLLAYLITNEHLIILFQASQIAPVDSKNSIYRRMKNKIATKTFYEKNSSVLQQTYPRLRWKQSSFMQKIWHQPNWCWKLELVGHTNHPCSLACTSFHAYDYKLCPSCLSILDMTKLFNLWILNPIHLFFWVLGYNSVKRVLVQIANDDKHSFGKSVISHSHNALFCTISTLLSS